MFSSRFVTIAVGIAALALGGLGHATRGAEALSHSLLFAAWIAAVSLLFALAIRLPLRFAGPRYRAFLCHGVVVVGAVVVAWLANVAVFRNDLHLDLSREGSNTPPPQLESVVQGLNSDVSLTYFYNSADENALKARDLLAVAARQNQHLHVRAIDLDKEPAAARRLGVRAYNSAVVEAEDRRVVVENTVDLAQLAYATLRALKRRSDDVCFVIGHGEAFSPTPPHLHYSHVETLKGHDVPGAGDVLVGAPDGLDRLQLALTTLGYGTRAIVLATLSAIPHNCAVVAEIGPRRPYASGETAVLARYLASGGRLLLLIDPPFPIDGELAELLARLGIGSDRAIIADPLNHYGTDPLKVAVPYYPPHPVTERVAMSIFPDARPIHVGQTPEGVSVNVLASSSAESHLQPAPISPEETTRAIPAAEKSGPRERREETLAVAVEGRWPDVPADQEKPFRLILVGNSNFAANAYFPYVSNGELAVGMIRWLAGDDAMPRVKPQSLSLEQIDLTRQQMRDIFLVVELILPLAVILIGSAVWWRRR